MARFFLPRKNLRDNRGLVDGQELAHLRKVLRLGPGDRITVFDDGGWEHEAVIRQLSAERGEIEILRSYQAGRESPLRMILAVGLTKGEKIDWVVEKATELGAHEIVPFTSTFAVPRLDEKKIAARSARWEKIAAPLRGVKYVEYHPEWVYFANRFGLKRVGSIELKPGIAPTPNHLVQLAQQIKQEKAQVLLYGSQNPRIPQQLQGETGIKVLRLYTSAGGRPETDSYIKWIDFTVRSLVQAVS